MTSKTRLERKARTKIARRERMSRLLGVLGTRRPLDSDTAGGFMAPMPTHATLDGELSRDEEWLRQQDEKQGRRP